MQAGYPTNLVVRTVRLRTYIVEDNATIRENLISTLEELACIQATGCAETEDDGKQWLTGNPEGWDLAIIDLFLKQGSGLGVLLVYLGVCALAVWLASVQPRSAGAIEEHAVQLSQAAEAAWDDWLPVSAPTQPADRLQ